MEILPIELFGFAIDVPFPLPMAFDKARLGEMAARLCDPAQGLGLRAEQVRLRQYDELFGYELHAHFFGDNGTLTQTAERAKLAVRNARNAADWTLVRGTLERFYKIMDFPATTVTTLSCHVHAAFETAEDRDHYLRSFAHEFENVRMAGLGYARIADWEKEIRVLIEQSNAVPNGLFVAWDTQFSNQQDWETFLLTLPTMMENAANLFGIGLEPFKVP